MKHDAFHLGSTDGSLFQNAIDMLSDGVAVLRHDSTIVYANAALRHLAANNSDFCIDRNAIRFETANLRSRFAAALSIARGINPDLAALEARDFAVSRTDDMPPFTVSVRPLRGEETDAEAAALLLVHDPLQQNLSTGRILHDLYGLTEAEAQMVQALGTGMTAGAYARKRRISVTTVYTHLRRTREKTGWRSVAELTRRFHELSVSLRTH
jgi:DNA-binding CsgD family transcriptional regulator